MVKDYFENMSIGEVARSWMEARKMSRVAFTVGGNLRLPSLFGSTERVMPDGRLFRVLTPSSLNHVGQDETHCKAFMRCSSVLGPGHHAWDVNGTYTFQAFEER